MASIEYSARRKSPRTGTRCPDLMSSATTKLDVYKSPWPCSAAERSAIALLLRRLPETGISCSPSGPVNGHSFRQGDCAYIRQLCRDKSSGRCGLPCVSKYLGVPQI